MGRVRDWIVASVIAGLILLSPVVAFLIIISVEVLIDCLMEAGTTAVCDIAAAGIGWVLYRRISRHPSVAPQPGTEPVYDEGAIAAPPI
jgi:hypothetical protein